MPARRAAIGVARYVLARHLVLQPARTSRAARQLSRIDRVRREVAPLPARYRPDSDSLNSWRWEPKEFVFVFFQNEAGSVKEDQPGAA